MSKLEQLINELCPDGVEWKTIGEIATIKRGGNFQKKDFTETGVPCIHYGQIYTKYGLSANKTLTFINEAIASKSQMACKNDIIMAVTSENIEDVCKCLVWLGESEVAISGHTAIIKHKQNAKFLVHYFTSYMFFKEKLKLAHGTKVIEVTPSKILGIEIPIPPLEVQEEIVRILDTFTELTAELTAELIARKKQYEYYFNMLFEDINNRKLIHFGSIAKIVRGASPRPINNFITEDEKGVNWIKIGDVDLNSKYITNTKQKINLEGAQKSRIVKPGDFIMSNSMSFGRAFILKIEGCIHDGWLSISDFHKNYTSDFLYYLLNTSYVQNFFENKASSGTIRNLNAEIVKTLPLPLYSNSEQQRIVHILDRFDTLCNDITQGLPAEIQARQKQYEYYRDKLLTFKRAEA